MLEDYLTHCSVLHVPGSHLTDCFAPEIYTSLRTYIKQKT